MIFFLFFNTITTPTTPTTPTTAIANVRDKHYATGSILLGVGVGVSILGGFNTYLRAGKLFPGPHLFAGMAITGK